ncbi:MAG: iron ABC transporter permease [Bacteroidaceae bacterium]|nr:iron ABC transporter permease [Bacteroidaceae bacterium]
MKKGTTCIGWMAALTLLLFMGNLFIGSVDIPYGSVWQILTGSGEERASWQFIVLDSRLPQALTALFCGAALSVSGLMLQTVFRNPLAGPSILGIDSGASLGVALVMLFSGGSMLAGDIHFSGFLAVTLAAFVGALFVMGLLLFFSTLLRSDVMLLIVGVMIGYLTSSVISLLNFFATSEGVHSYLIWGMGSFGGVSMEQMPWFAALVVSGICVALLLVKPLNALLLGRYYAENLGVNVRCTRYLLLFTTGLLSAATTAFCGPVSFLGLAVPHIARLILGRADHRLLMPLTLLTGSAVALLCNSLCVLPGDRGIIPLAAVTPLLGAPVILYVLLKGKR